MSRQSLSHDEAGETGRRPPPSGQKDQVRMSSPRRINQEGPDRKDWLARRTRPLLQAKLGRRRPPLHHSSRNRE